MTLIIVMKYEQKQEAQLHEISNKTGNSKENAIAIN
jgi:hypothetical protein